MKPAYGFVAVFVGVLSLAVVLGKIPAWVGLIYLVLSVVTFFLYALDKSAAKKDQWRTPENTLHALAFCCGWPGALVAQQSLRHKSAKKSFQWVFWTTVAFNCALLSWLALSGWLAR